MSQAQASIEVYDPNSRELIGSVPALGPEEVEAAVARARIASRRWGALSFDERRRELVHFRRGLARRADELAELMHRETGKPIVDAMGEVMVSLNHLNHAAHRAKRALGPRRVGAGLLANFKATLSYHPLGVIGVIGPWNYPMFTPFGSIAYALAAGNCVVFKPSELTPLIGLLIAEIAADTIAVPDVLQVVTGRGETGAALIRAGVDKIAFTGSANTGKKVMATAAESLTPVLLELGGKDALVVQADAEIDKAAEAAVFGAMTNAGQACVSIERAYVSSEVYDRFVDLVIDEAKALKTGGGSECQLGAITMDRQVETIRRHLEDAVEKGAKILCGGPDEIRGNCVPPTVLIDVTPEMAVMREETFGPVLPITKVDDAEEALELANDSAYGLGGAIFGKRGVRALAERMSSGMTAINSVIAFSAIPNLPFGGVRDSGFGRIHGDDGLKEFSRAKAVADKRFSLPVDLFSFKLPPNALDQLRMVVYKGYGGTVVDKAGDLLRKLKLMG